MIVEITKDNFDAEVTASEKPVVIDFWATWCGPCRMMAPIVDALADERDDIKVGKINVDDEGELARMFGIVSIPTIILIKDGKAVSKSIGYREKEGLLDALGL